MIHREYFERTMLFNSTIWTCALSGRPHLTYAEALESEKKHRKMIEAFPQVLKGPVVFIANLTKRSAISDLVDDVFNYVNTRYFKTEKVLAKEENTEQYVDCEVVGFVTPAHTSDASPNGKIATEDVKYRVKRLDDGKKSPMLWTVTSEHIRRKKKDNSSPFSKDKLKLFLKQCIEYNDIRMLTIKQEAYKKYVTEANISTLSSFYVGKQPIFNLSKVLADKNEKDKKKKVEQKKVEKKKAKEKNRENGETANGTPKVRKNAATKEKGKKTGKQSSLDAFVTKDGEKIENLKKARKLEEEEQKRQKELEAERQKQLAEERKKQIAEMNLLVQATVKTMNAMKDDLELLDQKPLPVAKPVQTLIPEQFFADAIMVQEFIYSYTDILEDKDKFRQGIDLSIMERALLTREVAGPLSDILQVLLGSIFAFQIEESNDINIEFEKGTILFKENIPLEQQEFIRQATQAAVWPQKYLSSNMSDLPIDATTLTELLRLHFLTSGARLNEVGSKFRFQERGGFQNADDPGVMFCVKNKHVLRALQKKTVYELPIDDIMNILKCLINQILTYSTVRDAVEERMETATKSRIALRNLYSAERKREATLAAEKKEILEEVKKAMETFEGTDEEKVAHKESLDKKADVRIKQLEAVGEREKKKFTDQMEQIKRDIFAYQLYLGSDRAYRSYWLFESLPGLFIEHEPFGGECTENPVENIHGLANCAPEKRYLFIKKMLQEKQNNNVSDKENKINNDLEVKPKSVDPSKALTDQQQHTAEEQPNVEVKYSQRDLFMCTGNSETCLVHRVNDPTRKVWTFLNTEDEINALIDSLNPRGIREKNLREQLESQKELILFHVQNCPIEKLQVDPATLDEKIEQIANDKTRAYLNANFSYPKGSNISEMMLNEIRKSILEMEFKLTAGQLGQLRVKDRLAWREAIDKQQYQMQEKYLQWGPHGQFQEGKCDVCIGDENGYFNFLFFFLFFADANGQIKKVQMNGKASNKKLVNGHATENGDDEASESEESEDEDIETKVSPNLSYDDPGSAFELVGNGIDDIDDAIINSAEYKKQIHDLACALLQISQSIDPKYFKPPFGNLKSGGKNGTKDQNAIKAKHSLDKWQVSLMNCKNPSQLFLHYNVLYDAIKWTRSAQNAKCVCRSSKDPDKLLLCDGCNVGRHIYCLKPKLTVCRTIDHSQYGGILTILFQIHRKCLKEIGSAVDANRISQRQRRSAKHLCTQKTKTTTRQKQPQQRKRNPKRRRKRAMTMRPHLKVFFLNHSK